MDVDFPEKHTQAEDVARANLALKARFNLTPVKDEGFPTIVLLDDAGQTVFQETGYGAAARRKFCQTVAPRHRNRFEYECRGCV